MFSAIKASLIEAIGSSDAMSDRTMDKATLRWKQIQEFLETHEFIIINADVRLLCNVSATTANRILSGLSAEGKIKKVIKGDIGHTKVKLESKFSQAFGVEL